MLWPWSLEVDDLTLADLAYHFCVTLINGWLILPVFKFVTGTL